MMGPRLHETPIKAQSFEIDVDSPKRPPQTQHKSKSILEPVLQNRSRAGKMGKDDIASQSIEHVIPTTVSSSQERTARATNVDFAKKEMRSPILVMAETLDIGKGNTMINYHTVDANKSKTKLLS